MKVLFVHQNFPGQFKHLAPALAARRDWKVRALHMRKDLSEKWKQVRTIGYKTSRASTTGVHPWIRDFETQTIRGEAALHAARALDKQGFTPDLIIGHPGWGEMLFLKDVWPAARMGLYCEFYYRPEGQDVNFDPEFPMDADVPFRLRYKNMANDYTFPQADAGIAPTPWQQASFPPPMSERIAVIHDGIDTDAIRPNPQITLTLNNQLHLDRASEVITFVNRNLEPYRGYHVFMRALPSLLARRPKARVLIIGGDSVSYGTKPTSGTWKERFLAEVRPQLSEDALSRIHFLGKLPYEHYLAVLQLSTVHVYLTYPFVLSWSLLESMSAGCAIVASDTAPVRDAITHNDTGVLVNFFDHAALAESVEDLLNDPQRRQHLGREARTFAREHNDLQTVCLPQQLAWVDEFRR